MFKSGFVAIIGRPNVGKSTIVNYLMGEKLAIVSNKPQTTRKNMNLILTEENYQIIFVDTPGIHKPKHKLGEYMVNEAEEMVTEVDLIIFVTNSNKEIHIGDIKILEELKGVKCPVFLVMNKSDEVNSDLLASSLEKHSEIFDFAEIIPTSARNGKNMDVLLNLILQNLKEGPMYYPEDIATDSQERFIVNELIREKALRFLKDEVPHGIAVEVVKMKDKEECYEISANLICEKKSHKGIIIGKNGQMLKKIKNSAKKDIEDFLGTKVNLDIWVKVRKDWRDNPLFLNQFGYKKLK